MFGTSIVAIVFLVVVLPIWIIAHYATRWRTTKTLSSGEEQLLTELWESAEKMDGRIRNLERILDAEAPDWRTRA
jgi:phage shock protein B